MSDDLFYTQQSRIVRLRVWALGQMMWGAFIAAVGVVAIGGVLGVIWVIGQFLPEQSKQAPSPYGALEIVQPVEAV